MMLKVCAIKDCAVQVFERPVFVPHTQGAMRSFADEVNRQGSADMPNHLNLHAEDFELWHVAEFDTETGEFVDVRQRIARGPDVKREV